MMDAHLIDLIQADSARWHALDVVQSLQIPSACIGAGFIRNLVWDHLHGRQSDCRQHDLDVLWFDRDQIGEDLDRELEHRLTVIDPSFNWSVKNQARMHTRNDDAPYASVLDAMRFWPETATAIAAQRQGESCQILAPFGIQDLMNGVLRPTSSKPHKQAVFEARLIMKNWAAIWPNVTLAAPDRA